MKTKSILLGMGLMAFTAFGNATVVSASSQLQGAVDNLSDANGTVDIQNDQNSNDEIWEIFQPSASTATFVASYWGNNDPMANDSFSWGIYDAADYSNSVELVFAANDKVTFSIEADNSVWINNADSGIDFASNAFGFFNTNEYNNVEYTGYSEESRNANGIDAMLTYHNQAGFLNPGQSLLAFDPNLSGDYDDFLVIIESAAPVPEPGTLALLGLGLAGLGFSRRKTKS